MINDSRPYPACKDSGLPWLGRIPDHWEVCRNGRLFAQRNEAGFPDLPILEVSLKTGVRVRDFDNSTRKQVIEDRSTYKRARRGDIAYNMMRMWQGAVGVAPVDGLISPAYVVARPLPGTNPRYFQYLFRTGAYMSEVNKFSRGIVPDRNRLYWEDFKQIPSPFPPPEEQAAIVRFLDHADRRIRRYIRAKQKLIKLLQEQKQAVIHHAVTRGLDPNVRLKPSGVEWLGDVPEHWNVQPIGRIGQLFKGNGGNKGDEVPSGIPCVRYGDLYTRHEFFIRDTKAYLSPEKAAEYTPIRYGDVLFAASGETIEDIGRSAVNLMESEARCGGDVLLLRPAVEAVPKFLGYVADSTASRNQKACMGRGFTVVHIYGSQLKRLVLPLPPLPEQAVIVRFLDEATASITTATDRAYREITLLREYRTRLIADVVTGKLDVREAAARLPDEPEDSEIPDEMDVSSDVDAVATDDLADELAATGTD